MIHYHEVFLNIWFSKKTHNFSNLSAENWSKHDDAQQKKRYLKLPN